MQIFRIIVVNSMSREHIILFQLMINTPFAVGGLFGVGAAPHRGTAGEDEPAAHGRALLPVARWFPAAGEPHFPWPPAAAGGPGVPRRRLDPQRNSPEILLQ